jgi:hypothetical protein
MLYWEAVMILIGTATRCKKNEPYFCRRCKAEILDGQHYYNCPPGGDLTHLWCQNHEPSQLEAALVMAKDYLDKGDLKKGLEYVTLALGELER